jgi:hypothetical protein
MKLRHETLPSLRDVDRVAAMVTDRADLDRVDAVRQAVLAELELLRIDAEIALDGDLHADMRGPLLAYLTATARLHGRTPAQQVVAFMADRDELFTELSFRAWGVRL